MRIPYIISLILLFCSLQAVSLNFVERKTLNFNELIDFAEIEFPDLFPEHQTTQTYSGLTYTSSTIPDEWLYRLYSNGNALGIYLLNELFIALPFINSRADKNITKLGTFGSIGESLNLENDPEDSCFLDGV